MSFTITQASRNVIQSGTIEPQIVLEIDGYPDLLTSATISEVARYDAEGLVYDMPGLVYDGLVAADDQENLISLDGTTNNITQQLLQDDGGTSSTTNVTIAMLNKDNRLSSLVTPVLNDDILSKKASVWLGARGTSFPEDFIRIFVGNVSQVTTSGGIVKVTVSHPENLKRAELFTKIQTETTAAINNSVTMIDVETTNGLLLPSANGLLKTYVRIDDEIIEYTSLAPTQLLGCVRGSFDTIATSHDDEAGVDSFYKLGDATVDSNAVDLALQVLISKSEQPWIVDEPAFSFGTSPNPSSINSIFFSGANLPLKYNLQVGDTVTVTGATEVANNVTDALIVAVLVEDTGTRCVLTGVTLIPEASSSALCSFRSQYDTLTEGVGMTPDQVDIEEFRRIYDLFSSSLLNYEIYLKDTIKGNDLINKELLFPSACYSLPRKGRVSLGKTKPPIAEFETQILDETSILNANELNMERSVLENFFNGVVFRYQEDTLDEKFLAGRVTVSASSFARIKKAGNRPLTIDSKGLRRTNDNENVIDSNSQRILDRFQFGAEQITGMQVPFSVGWNMEVGDTAVVQGLQLFDSKTGDRGLSPRIMEVTNRSFNFRQGTIKLDLVDTAFSVDGRYGVVSPSSYVDAGSTPTRLLVKKSFGTGEFELEQLKWLQYFGLTVLVHDPDWTVQGEAELLGFDPSNESAMLLGPGLGFTPSEDDIIEIAHYDQAEALYKTIHCFFNPQVLVTANSVVLDEVEVADPSLFFVGSIVRIHNFDYSNDSGEALIEEINGSVLTLDRDITYLPQIDDEIDLIGFVSDEGKPFRIL